MNTSTESSPSPSTPSPRDARRALLWALGAFATFTLFLHLLSNHLAPLDRYSHDGYPLRTVPTLDDSVVQWQVTSLLQPGPADDILLLGDSSCLTGIIPSVIQEALHAPEAKIRNAGTVGFLGTEGFADLAAAYLERRGPPRLLVYSLSAWTLGATAADIEEKNYRKHLLEWEAFSASSRVRPPLAARLPYDRIRRSAGTLFHRVLFPARGARYLESPRGPAPSDNEVHRLLDASHGFLPEFHEPMSAPAQPQDKAVTLTEDAERGLRRLLQLADERGFDLVVVLSPLPDLYDTPQTRKSFAVLEARLRAVTSVYRRASLRTPLLRFLPTSEFGTELHPRERGAEINSRDLGAWLAESRFSIAAGAKNEVR